MTFLKSYFLYRFFSPDSTAEILATIMPLISPLDSKSLSTHLSELCLFLPTESHQNYHLWLNDMLSLWDSCSNSSSINHVSNITSVKKRFFIFFLLEVFRISCGWLWPQCIWCEVNLFWAYHYELLKSLF